MKSSFISSVIGFTFLFHLFSHADLIPSAPPNPTSHQLNYNFVTQGAGSQLKNPQAVMYPAQIDHFLSAIRSGDPEVILDLLTGFDPDDLIRESVHQFYLANLLESQLSTINYFSSAIKQFITTKVYFSKSNPRKVHIGTRADGIDNTKVKNAFSRMQILDYDDPRIIAYFGLNNETTYPIPGGVEDLYLAQMKSASGIESKALLIPVPSKNTKNWSPLYDQLSKTLNYLGLIEYPAGSGLYSIVIPSDTIMQTIIDISSRSESMGGRGVSVFHRFGKLSAGTVGKAASAYSWIVSLYHPDLEPLLVADGYFGGFYVFSLHDFYHAVRWSRVGALGNSVFSRIKMLTLNLRKHGGLDVKDSVYSSLLNVLTDGELHDSRKGETIETGLFYLYDVKKRERFHKWPAQLLVEILSDFASKSFNWRDFFEDRPLKLAYKEKILFQILSELGELGKDSADLVAPILDALESYQFSEFQRLLLEAKEEPQFKPLLTLDTPFLEMIGIEYGSEFLEFALQGIPKSEFMNQHAGKSLGNTPVANSSP